MHCNPKTFNSAPSIDIIIIEFRPTIKTGLITSRRVGMQDRRLEQFGILRRGAALRTSLRPCSHWSSLPPSITLSNTAASPFNALLIARN